MILVVVRFESGEQREVELEGVPRKGDAMRFREGSGDSLSYVVEHVLWVVGASPPGVIVVIAPNGQYPK